MSVTYLHQHATVINSLVIERSVKSTYHEKAVMQILYEAEEKIKKHMGEIWPELKR